MVSFFLLFLNLTKPLLKTQACSMWTYTDTYKAIIKYIDTDLRNTDYVLNFGVVAIATQSSRASVKFCLKNIQTNKQKCWTLLLTGETLLALETDVRNSVAIHLGKF